MSLRRVAQVARLLLVGGVRYERTKDEGQGPFKDTNAIYQRDASGKLVRDASGRTILLTTDATAQTRLQYIDRGSRVGNSYDGYYPSANATFNAFVPRNANWGVSLNRPRYTLMLKWIYRADQRLLARTGTGVPAGDFQ